MVVGDTNDEVPGEYEVTNVVDGGVNADTESVREGTMDENDASTESVRYGPLNDDGSVETAADDDETPLDDDATVENSVAGGRSEWASCE